MKNWTLVGILGLVSALSCDIPMDISYTAAAPESIQIGEEFALILRLENTAHHEQELVCVDIDGSYLEGFELIRTEPEYQETLDLFGQGISLYFHKALEYHKEVQVRLILRAVEEGDFAGDIKACINSQYALLPFSVKTTVTN